MKALALVLALTFCGSAQAGHWQRTPVQQAPRVVYRTRVVTRTVHSKQHGLTLLGSRVSYQTLGKLAAVGVGVALAAGAL